MGKIFYASDKDKVVAGRKVNDLARRYKKGVCWTPSRQNQCKYDAKTELWTCRASAHHHYGSCGTWEITHGGRGTEWQLGWTWEHDWGGTLRESPPNNLGAFEDYDQPGKEEYEDASPEDYMDMAHDNDVKDN